MNTTCLLSAVLAVALLIPAHARAASPAPRPSAELLARALAGHPALTPTAALWAERDGAQFSVRRYTFQSQQYDDLARRAAPIDDLAADATRAIWVERGDQFGQVVALDLASGTVTQLATLASASGTVALDGAQWYLADSRGLQRFSPGKAPELLSPLGRRPVAHGGAVLWSEEQFGGERQRAAWRLLLREPGGQTAELAQQLAGYGGLAGYTLTDDAAFWSFAGAADTPGLVRFDRASGARDVVAPAAATLAATPGTLVWSAVDEAAQPLAWRIQRASAQGIAPVIDAPAALAVEGLLGSLMLVSRENDGARELLLLNIDAAPVLPAIPPPAAALQELCGDPLACGQVRASGAVLADNGGRWVMRGVQFFLPRYGINGKSFWDANYAAAAASGEIDFWLERAQRGLNANTLRLFVDLPYTADGASVVPTSYATLYDFARRAAAHGMRLGIALHNSADWAMTPEHAAWIGGLLDDFAARSALPLIAYLNADNEINNHCGAGNDCFDRRPGYDDAGYIAGALEWTAQFRAVVKRHAPVLVTAGISSEVRDYDNTRAAFDYLRPDRSGRRLLSLIDMLAPHNYSGGADGVIDDLRYAGYAGPIVLEEFGYPTDPRPLNPSWTEGAATCRQTPLATACRDTAPFFVATNLAALRSRSYSGGAAWMLADVDEKNRADACTTQRFDFWTGLFASGGAYCEGGTATRVPGAPKATAVQVCRHYGGDFFACDPSLVVRARLYLPVARR